MRSRPARPHRVRRALVIATAAGVLALAGCSGASQSDSVDAGAVAEEPARPRQDGLASSAEDGAGVGDSAVVDELHSTTSTDNAASPAARVGPSESVIRTGQVTLTAQDLNRALDGVERLVQRYGGHLAQERTRNDESGRTQRTDVELRVPSKDFRTVLEALEEVGKVQSATTKEEDVTTEVIDVDSRIRTQEVSLGRLRAFLGRATTVSATIRLESEIARREADLASLRAQRDYLEDQTSLSTIELTMHSAPARAAAAQDPLDSAGFLTGLSNGWHALLDVLVVAATVVGVAIPFAVLVALVGAPLAVWLRWSRRRQTPAGPTTPEPAA